MPPDVAVVNLTLAVTIDPVKLVKLSPNTVVDVFAFTVIRDCSAVPNCVKSAFSKKVAMIYYPKSKAFVILMSVAVEAVTPALVPATLVQLTPLYTSTNC